MRSAFVLPILIMRPPFHVFDRRLRRDEHRSHLDSQRAIEILQFEIIQRGHRQRSRIVDENVDPAQFRRRALHSGEDRAGIGAISVYRQGSDSERLRGFCDFVGPFRRA